MNEKLLPLKDFHLPPEPGIWPLAPGWWALLALLLLSSAILVWLRHRHRQKARRDYRKEAKLRLATLIDTYRQDNNLQGLSMQVNQLLKQICLSAISPKAARLIDDAWVEFLNQQLNPSSTSLQHNTHIFLVKQPYTTNALLTPDQIDDSLTDIKNWLEQHRGELLNVDL